MKKIFIGLALVLLLLIGAAIALPVIFKDSILEKVKTLINNQVNAKVEFADFKLSFFRSFPKIQAELVDFTLIGLNEFEGDTIAAMGSLATNVSLSDLLGNDGLSISLIELTDAQVNLKVNKNNQANWDIVPTSGEEVAAEPTAESASGTINLNSIKVNKLSLAYLDETMPMLLEVNNINLDVAGSLKGMITTFNIDGKAEELLVEYDSVNYISKVALALQSKLTADMDKLSFEFGEDSQFQLNDLPIALSGVFGMPSDTMTFDVKMQVPESNFEKLLALVPADYQSYLEGVSAVGDAGFDGTIKGYMYEEDYPAMNFNMYVNKATMQYAGMPEKIKEINLNVNINQPQGSLDGMVVNVSKAHAEVRNNPIDAQLLLKTPMSDMAFDAKMSAAIDFATLKDAIPMDSVDLQGKLSGNVALNGTMSAVEKKDYEKITANGLITFANFIFQSPSISKPIELTSGSVNINNQTIDMNKFAAKISQSDFTLNGKLTNYLGYALQNQQLKGNFALNSKLIDCNELLSLMPEEETQTSEQTTTVSSDSILIFQVPEKLDLTFTSKIDKILFDDLSITHVDGLITLANQKLWLKNLAMNMLDGTLKLDGSYAASTLKEANFDFQFNVDKFTIPAAYASFASIRRYLPIAKSASGELSADLKLAGKLDEKLELIAQSLNGAGEVSTHGVQLAKTETIEKLNQVFKTDKLNKLMVDDFSADLSVSNGNFLVKPFSTKIAGQEAKVSGEVLVDQTMDLGIDFNIKKSDLNSEIAQVLNVIPGANKLESYPIGVNIKGEISKPSVSPDLTEAKNQIAEELKKSAKENAGKVIDEVGNAIKGLFGK